MTYTSAAVLSILMIVVLFFLLFGPRYISRERPKKEGYGPPPGMNRAISHYELGCRGWPQYPPEYHANTASAISHMIERSA